MKKERGDMKILKIENGCGYFLRLGKEEWKAIDEIDKDDPFYGTPWGTFSAWKNEEMDNLWSKLTSLCDNQFKRVMVGESDHIWRAFYSLFGGKDTK